MIYVDNVVNPKLKLPFGDDIYGGGDGLLLTLPQKLNQLRECDTYYPQYPPINILNHYIIHTLSITLSLHYHTDSLMDNITI